MFGIGNTEQGHVFWLSMVEIICQRNFSANKFNMKNNLNAKDPIILYMFNYMILEYFLFTNFFYE